MNNQDTICENCGESNLKNFCGNCGHKKLVSRIDYEYVKEEIIGLIGFEKGFLYTSKELLIKPGRLINTYLYKSRLHITKPIAFITFASLIYTLISHFLQTDIFYAEILKKTYGDNTLSKINTWIQENNGYSNLLLVFPTLIWLKIIFKKYQYNYYEVFVVLCYVMGFGMLIACFQPILDYLFPSNFAINNLIIITISFTYIGFALTNFYGNTLKNFFTSISAYIFGFITFQVVLILIAKLYDILIKFL